MNKRAVISLIVAQLTHALETLAASARAAHAEATHEQSKAENKYDTRGLEASYLAHGQSRQAAELEQARRDFEALPITAADAETPIDLGALLTLKSATESLCYFLGPRAGGLEITLESTTVMVITPQSPLGQQLLGKKQGDRVTLQRQPYRIVRVK